MKTLQEVCPAQSWVLSHRWFSPVRCCSQNVCTCVDMIPWLIVPYVLLFSGSAFLHQQSVIPIADHHRWSSLCISAHRKCVSASIECHSDRWTPSLIIPCGFVLTASAFLHQQSVIPIADHHLWSSLLHLCSQAVRFCINRVSFSSLIIPCAFVLTGSAFLHHQSVIPIADHHLIIPHAFVLTTCAFLYQQSVIPATDHPLCIYAHRKCVSTFTESYSYCWLSPAHCP